MSFSFFFFKQKTAYEMRISDWSSDVCSSDLRVRLLEQSGVIRGYTTIVAGGSPEEGMIAIVQVELERQSEEYLLRFEAALRRHAEIQEWFLMTGDGDYILRVQIGGIDDYGAFHRDVLSRLPGVARITSSFAMRSHRRR